MIKLKNQNLSFFEKLTRLALGLTLLTMVGSVLAKPDNITDAEMQLLPPYCQDSKGFKSGDA